MGCGGLNQISSLDVPTLNGGFGAALDVSSFASDKSIELYSDRPYSGSYVLYGSHDGTLYVPLLTFDSGSGQQQFKIDLDMVVHFLKVKKKSQSSPNVTMLVAGQAACNCAGTGSTGANQFIALAALNAGTSGPRPSIDLWNLVPSTGIDAVFNVMCGGDFVGTVGLEGSLDGTHFAPCGTDMEGNAVGGFVVSAKGVGAPSTELSPVLVPNVVRYLRPNVAAVISGPVSMTLGGAQNCDCQPG